MKKTKLYALLSSLLIISMGVIPSLAKGQIFSVSTTFVCPGDTILVVGDRFASTTNVTIDGHQAFFDCSIDADNCTAFGVSADTMRVIIPFGPNFGSLVDLIRIDAGLRDTVAMNVCQGLQPTAACIGETVKIFENFTGANTISSIRVDGTIRYDDINNNGIPAPIMIGGDSAVVFPVPGGLPQGVSVSVDVTYGPFLQTFMYSLFIKNDGASFAYASDTICKNNGLTSPSTPPIHADTFYSTPSGLVSNTATGQLDPSSVVSSQGYIITHKSDNPLSCDSTFILPVYISVVTDPTFTYPDTVYCTLDPVNPVPSSTGGVFLSNSLSTFVLNSSTGEINLSAAPPGVHTITQYEEKGSLCERTHSFTLRIGQTPVVNFSYADACFGSSTNPVAIPGPGHFSSGTYSDVSGLLNMTNPATGQIAIGSFINPASWPIAYEIDNNKCITRDTQSVNILTAANSSILYNLPQYCIAAGATAIPSVGNSGGSFSFVPTQFGDSMTINSLGVVTLDSGATDTGTYYVIYSLDTPLVTCPNMDTTTIEIVAAPSAFFMYGNRSYCQLDADPFPSVSTGGGLFTELTNNIIFVDSSTGEIDLSASAAGGPYVIQYFVTAGTCTETSFGQVSIEDSLDAGFYYGIGPTICKNVTNPVPTITGSGGGVFSSDGPSDLYFVADTTGVINLDSSSVGVYTIYYTVGIGACAGIDSVQIQILAEDVAQIEYPNPILCKDPASTPLATPSIAGSAGMFDDPLGQLTITAGTGEIDINASTVGGPYIVEYTTTGNCPVTLVDTVTISVPAPAQFYYADTAYCPSDNFPVPVVLGVGGGTWTPSDSVIFADSTIGQVDLASSKDDTTHTITYTSPGPCPSSFDTTISILPGGVATFRYNGGPFCSSDTINPLPTTDDPTSSGTFTALDPGIVVIGNTGEIVIDSSSPGTYTIQYFVGGNGSGCEDVAFASVTIGLADTSAITYDTQSTLPPNFCVNEDDPLPNLVGTPGGIYVSSGTNQVFFVNESTGQIDLSRTGPATIPFTVTYQIPGNCAGIDATASFIINPVDTADFHFENALGDTAIEFCNSSDNPFAVTQSLRQGLFTKGADSLGVVLDSLTGEVDLLGSQPGTYNLSYQTLDTLTGCRDTASVQITINEDPVATLRTNLKDSVICDSSVVRLTALGGNPLVDCFTYEIITESDTSWQPYQNLCGDITGNILDTNGIPLGLNQIRMTLTNGFGCTAQESLFVQVNPVPQGIILDIPEVISGREQVPVIVQSLSDDTQFAWTLKGIGDVRPIFASGFTDVLQMFDLDTIRTTTVVTISENNPSQIRVSVFPTSNGCIGTISTDTIRVIPNNQNFFIPEIMTPNGNNQNDFWMIQWNQNIRPSDYYIQVFNRMGGMVYTLQRLDNIWYGGGLPDGIYWWVLRRRDSNNVIDKGGLKIIRE